MCLVIAHFSENKELDFILGGNRDDIESRRHQENYIDSQRAWPSVGEGQTWIGISKSVVASLLNYYPDEKIPERRSISRGFIVPQLLSCENPRLENITSVDLVLEEVTPFQVVTYIKATKILVHQIWDGENILTPTTARGGTHIFVSSSYGLDKAEERKKKTEALIQEYSGLEVDSMRKILATTESDGTRSPTSPCMKGNSSATIGSHIVEVCDQIKITGFAGSPNDKTTQSVQMEVKIK